MNFNKVKGRIKEKNMSQKDVAKILNITLQSFNAKLNNKQQFTLGEVIKLSEILDIEDPKTFFFTNNILNMQRNEGIDTKIR